MLTCTACAASYNPESEGVASAVQQTCGACTKRMEQERQEHEDFMEFWHASREGLPTRDLPWYRGR